jgi:K+-transporting ATPase KdpF subunit
MRIFGLLRRCAERLRLSCCSRLSNVQLQVFLRLFYAFLPFFYIDLTLFLDKLSSGGFSWTWCLSLSQRFSFRFPGCWLGLPTVLQGKGAAWGIRRHKVIWDDMDILYWICGVVAAGLLVYLVAALLKPEIFS